jgi:hypothetical protein
MQNSEPPKKKIPAGSIGFVVLSVLIWFFIWILRFLVGEPRGCRPLDFICQIFSLLYWVLFVALIGASLLVLFSVLVLLSSLRRR